MAKVIVYPPLDSLEAVEGITKTRIFKYIENFTTKKVKTFK